MRSFGRRFRACLEFFRKLFLFTFFGFFLFLGLFSFLFFLHFVFAVLFGFFAAAAFSQFFGGLTSEARLFASSLDITWGVARRKNKGESNEGNLGKF